MNTVSSRRSITRRFALEKQALDNVGSEIAGSILSPVTTGLTGAGIAALVAALRGKNVRHAAGGGAVLGAALGAPLLEGGGVLAGVLSKRRTRKEQQEHDSKSHWASLLPGVAAYNRTKRMGRVLAGVGEPDEQKKAAEAAYLDGFCKAAEALGVSPRRLAMHMAVKEAALKPGAAFRLVRTALEGRRGSELGGKVLATHSFLSGTGRLSPGTADNLAHMLRLDEAIKGATRAGYMPYKGRVSLPDMVRAAHLDVSGVGSTPRSEAVRALLREMGYGK